MRETIKTHRSKKQLSNYPPLVEFKIHTGPKCSVGFWIWNTGQKCKVAEALGTFEQRLLIPYLQRLSYTYVRC
jgi:hypothetical protein